MAGSRRTSNPCGSWPLPECSGHQHQRKRDESSSDHALTRRRLPSTKACRTTFAGKLLGNGLQVFTRSVVLHAVPRAQAVLGRCACTVRWWRGCSALGDGAIGALVDQFQWFKGGARCAAVRAVPVGWHGVPRRACGNARGRAALGFLVESSATGAQQAVEAMGVHGGIPDGVGQRGRWQALSGRIRARPCAVARSFPECTVDDAEAARCRQITIFSSCVKITFAGITVNQIGANGSSVARASEIAARGSNKIGRMAYTLATTL